MQALAFYLVYPFVVFVAYLPYRALYVASDVLFFLLRLSGYRRKVVLGNLRNSFPLKSEKEINKIADSYYRYLCDLVLETLKTLRMTEEEVRERCTCEYTSELQKFFQANQSLILVMGHHGNWEWAGPSFSLATPFQLVVIYRPLANPYFEKMLTKMRTRHKLRITPVKNTLRDMVANRNQLTATAFVADQTATRKDAYWMEFLNQDTAVFTGPEKLAKKFGYPVVYISVSRIKRGYYRIVPEVLFDNPQATGEGEITEVFTRRLERDIVADPSIWLWSHKRWKHKRPAEPAKI